MIDSSERIFVPSAERGRLIAELSMSVRLANVLETDEVKLAGDLHGRTYSEFLGIRNCGKKTLNELRAIVRELQVGSPEASPAFVQRQNPNILQVSAAIREVLLDELPLSVRLGGVLRASGYRKLGDLHGAAVGDLLRVENCGRTSIAELRRLLQRAELGEFTSVPHTGVPEAWGVIVRSIDAGMRNLGPRNRKIVEERLSGNQGELRTLEEVGDEFGITRERVRQIVKVGFEKIRRSGGPVLARALETVERDCEDRVVPLTVSLLTQRLAEGLASAEHDSLFYVRALDQMAPSIPAWPAGTTREGADDPQTGPILEALETLLRTGGSRPTAREAFEWLQGRAKFAALRPVRFFSILRRARKLIVDFPGPDEPRLRLRRLRLFDITLPVLSESAEPLAPEEIMERARVRFGADAILLSGRSAENALSAYPGVFRLGPRSFGLRKHFASTERDRVRLRDRFALLLRTENRPISSIEVCDVQSIALPAGVNSYELAEVLREDDRFIDLGRRLFGLAEWGVEEREQVKDLLPGILADADRPLTVSEIYERLTKIRSATLTGLSNVLRKHPEIQPIGFSYHGLRAWGDSRRTFLVSKRSIVERAVRRADSPIRFAALCDVFGIPREGNAADALWKSCAGSEKLRRAPDHRDPDTLLMHKAVSLEQALASICRALGRPARGYELEWELRERFGGLFDRIRLRQIEERLAKSPRFLRNIDGTFLLDADLDLEDIDIDALRSAAARALGEVREILDCDDLIERLELQGIDLEDVSPGMLASILRGSDELQEVGRQRFRAK